ncbi:flagellar hook-associated protein 3 FlgL [Caloramator quimbayensis]|uniref:Flagellar hook-associated protein 3 FlgL n=1 Tax=Caloramator quimbayensis TaxID=1147123 RepID=A0A1T4XAM7_9CLOT|nr:flagellar hook-associated protein FlgL [Caloramator quimbayensis]SKA86158.1 flagellar hook-associated protein 3 FlgL [Caloramator quimbayensis]
MRITNKVLSKGYLDDLNRNIQNMRKYQEQLSSGHEVRRPSDDPFKVARTMELNSSIAANDRYKSNIEEGIGWLETTDKALGQINDALQRVRELTIQAGGNYTKEQRQAIQKEIDQLKDHIREVGNTAYDGRYIFGGDKTTNPPFEADVASPSGITYKGSTNGLLREFSQGVAFTIDVPGNKFESVFNVLKDISDTLNAGDSPAGKLGDLDNEMDKILNLRAEVGAKSNRLDAMKSKNEEETFNMTELLSKTQDIDIAKKVMEYKVMESVYNASLQTGAKILQPSILDFLR